MQSIKPDSSVATYKFNLPATISRYAEHATPHALVNGVTDAEKY